MSLGCTEMRDRKAVQSSPALEEGSLNQQSSSKRLRTFDGVVSQVIIRAEKAEPNSPPCMTNAGPCPKQLSNTALLLPARLHDAQVGRVYVGRQRTTLMLQQDYYYAGVSEPKSEGVARAHAESSSDLRLNGVAAILYTNGAEMFSHWTFDLLPKLEVLRRAGWTSDGVDYYIVNSFEEKFRVEGLERLGIPPGKVIAFREGIVSADRLLIPSRIRARFNTPRWVRIFANEVFGPRRDGDDGWVRPTRRIYISRVKARRRRVLNEDAVRGVLEQKGFQTVYAEEHSVAEMAHLVSQSETVVATHGAGMTHVVFAQQGTKVLEMYSAHIVPEGWLMTSAVGGRHFLLAGKSENGLYPWEAGAYEGFSQAERNCADFVVDPDDLERALAMMSVT